MKAEKRTDIRIVRCVVCIILSVVWMGVIFGFSSRTADESTKESNVVGMLVGKIFIPEFKDWSEEEQLRFAQDWEYPIRKTAHMTEYAVLGFLLTGALTGRRFHTYKTTAVLAFCLAVLYAATDEIHQYFVPGRACRIYDVGFDAAGALVGIMVGTALLAWWDKKWGQRLQ
jgi:VanZ family protein